MLKNATRCLILLCVDLFFSPISVHRLAGFIPMRLGQNRVLCCKKIHMLTYLFLMKSWLFAPFCLCKLIAWFQVSILQAETPFSAGSNPFWCGLLSIFTWLSYVFHLLQIVPQHSSLSLAITSPAGSIVEISMNCARWL